jgi:glutathionyl-hydroquinone reductase
VPHRRLTRFGLRDLYATPGIAATIDMDHIKRTMRATNRSIWVVQAGGPDPDLNPIAATHARHSLTDA